MSLVRLLIVAVLAILWIGCKSTPQATSKGSDEWAGQMQGLAQEVRELIPYVYSRQGFFDPANAPKIREGLKHFTLQAHKISPEVGKQYFGDDPLVEFSLENLRDDVGRASEAFSSGQLEYARASTKAALNHCFRCHSIMKDGNKGKWDLSQLQSVNMTPLERTDLLVATRRYEDASRFLESLMADREFIQNFPFDFEAALRKYFALMIRVERNPERPLHELDRILQIKEIPSYIAEQARSWRQSVLEWSHTANKKSKVDLLAQAEARVKRAGEMQQYSKDHAGDIEYLRATNLLHDYLRQNKSPKNLAEVYFLLGRSYEVLDELGDYNLHEIYYESCIRNSPKSPLAKRCYNRLEASIYVGYSGSSGIHIPPVEMDRLKSLREMTF